MLLVQLPVHLLVAAGCGGRRDRGAEHPNLGPAGSEVTSSNYLESSRTWLGMPVGHRSREILRDGLVRYCVDRGLDNTRGGGVRDGEAIEDTWHWFQEATQWYGVADFSLPDLDVAESRGSKRYAGVLVGSSTLYPLAHRVWLDAAKSGNEARALSALRVLSLVRAQEATEGGESANNKPRTKPRPDRFERLGPAQLPWVTRYEHLAEWSVEARQAFPDQFSAVSRLADVWDNHAAATPGMDVLEHAAELQTLRANLFMEAMQSRGGAFRLFRSREFGPSAQLQRQVALSIAIPYLRVGEIDLAATAIDDLPGGRELQQVLKEVSGESPGALLELAQAFDAPHLDVRRGLCRYGYRVFDRDVRFVTCLARTAAQERDFAQATEWYMEAVQRMPEEQSGYDEALQAMELMLTQGLYDSDPTMSRRLASKAEAILQERLRLWPDSSPAVAPEELHYLLGLLETNAGNAEGAIQWYTRSIEEKPSLPAVLQMARLQRLLGNAQGSLRYLHQATRMPGTGISQVSINADLQWEMGLSLDLADRQEEAVRSYRIALEHLNTLTKIPGASGSPELHAQRGVILHRLGEHKAARDVIRVAAQSPEPTRDVYARILSYLVMAEPDPELAQEVFRQAQRRLALQAEWRVYFALWVAAIQARAGLPLQGDALYALEQHRTDAAWWGSLARLGLGETTVETLVGEASNRGERAEAYCYAAFAALQNNETQTANQYFAQVLETQMVNFYEYAMAQALHIPDP